MAWTCPVCHCELVEDYRDVLDGHTLLESAEHCPNGCYENDYAYGNGSERIGREVIDSAWTESDSEFQERSQRRLAAIDVARRERELT